MLQPCGTEPAEIQNIKHTMLSRVRRRIRTSCHFFPSFLPVLSSRPFCPSFLHVVSSRRFCPSFLPVVSSSRFYPSFRQTAFKICHSSRFFSPMLEIVITGRRLPRNF
jgi:hypothetical protein